MPVFPPEEGTGVPESGPPSPTSPPHPHPYRRRGSGGLPGGFPGGLGPRALLLLGCAALLGTVGGVATGYTVQAGRAPTPLPPLSQAGLSHPDEPSAEESAPAPLTAEEDRRVRTEGDLRELLLDAPGGARDADPPFAEDGWAFVPGYVADHEDPGDALQELLGADIRRIAVTSWAEDGHRTVDIALLQFHGVQWHSARAYAARLRALTREAADTGDGGSGALRNSGNGRYYILGVSGEPVRPPGREPRYRARAVAQRGDLVLDIRIHDTRPVRERDIASLAERQLERL
ncbi:hypothetical protein CUT44_12455 [Streptomyces carminius]|uniref:Uncharacterized protein n=1 Tax=Streptomyces carminius TaxID=2665496 RepID=A0A2M8LZV2_9ACTN|nr:hypothetical protein [Streptomyces carminius]PJE97486.1 hypothetical protein CUT44_12455 [Streptomyces carminius]